MSALENLTVLLVDDNQNMRRIATTILTSVGIRQVHAVGDGVRALEVLRETPIDLAIVDFNMFPLDGVEFTRLVRNSPDSPNRYLQNICCVLITFPFKTAEHYNLPQLRLQILQRPLKLLNHLS